MSQIDRAVIDEVLAAAPAQYFSAMFDRDTKLGHIVLGYFTVCHRWVGELNLGAVPMKGQGYKPCPDCLSLKPPKQLRLFGNIEEGE